MNSVFSTVCWWRRLRSRSSIVLASVIYITVISLLQSLAIMGTAAILGYGWPGTGGLALVVFSLLLLVFAVTALSLGLAFALPGHIELIAVIFVANLPLLFASTALAPLSFMPSWLGWLAALNPLTFAIEPIRAAYSGPVGSLVRPTGGALRRCHRFRLSRSWWCSPSDCFS